MKSLAIFALLLATAGVITAQVIPNKSMMGQKLIGSPFIKHLLRALAPPDDCDGAGAGDLVMDTSDCTQFYMCVGDGVMLPDPFQCGDDFTCFDPAAATPACINDEAACKPLCEATECKRSCAALGDNIADSIDCNRHYLCLGDDTAGKIELYCPDERPHFNGKECVNDKAQCCTCQVEKCTDAGQFLADPQDCHAFYACADPAGDGNLIPFGPSTCAHGGSFLNGACDPHVTECENICDLGGGGDSTISSLSTSVSTLSTSPSTLSTSTAPTTLTSTTSTATPTTTPGCLDTSDFTCPGRGFYPRCPFCDPSYFSCAGVGGSPTQRACSGNLVFNPTPEYPRCMLREYCPH